MVDAETMSRSGRASRGLHRARVALVILCVPAFLGLAADEVVAQTRRPAGKGHTPSKSAVTRNFAPPPDGGTLPSGDLVPGASAAPLTSGAAMADAGVVEARRLDGGTQVFKFKELDIEGRLKSPQLVYFLRRVRAEFAAGELGHRTFMREMSETRKESTF
jgi:hypothetical protein